MRKERGKERGERTILNQWSCGSNGERRDWRKEGRSKYPKRKGKAGARGGLLGLNERRGGTS